MAKQIKAIKCPHCSSVSKTKLDKDLYHCENCDTDYFLDNDDININVNHKTANNKNTFDIFNNKKITMIISLIIVLLFVGMMINSTLNKSEPSKNGVYTNSSSTLKSKPVSPQIENKSINYSINNHVFYTYFNQKHQANSFQILYRNFGVRGEKLSGIYYEIRDVLTSNIIKRDRLLPAGSNKEWNFRRFDNVTTYLVYDDARVFLFNEEEQTVNEVTQSLFENHPEFSSGLATVRLAAWGYEDCFYVLTNNGKEYFFYPLLDKIYAANDPELRKYFTQLGNMRESADEPYIRTSYVFKKFDDNPILIKVVYKTKNIAERDKFGFTHSNNSDKPYKINLQYNEGPIIEDKVLAKDRIFFNPSVIYGTNKELIIISKNNAAPNSFYNLQSLDVNTGEVKWTVKSDESLDFSTLVLWGKHNLSLRRIFILNKDGYMVRLGDGRYITISEDGKVCSLITYKPEVILEKDIVHN